jgi:RHS repeat-associated protein
MASKDLMRSLSLRLEPARAEFRLRLYRSSLGILDEQVLDDSSLFWKVPSRVIRNLRKLFEIGEEDRLQKTSTLPGFPGASSTYNANDELTTDAYDADGNTVGSGLNTGTSGYVYDFENRLVQQGGISIVYDGDGNRVSKTTANATTQYLVDDENPTGYAQVMDEVQSSAATRTYTWGLDLISEHQTLNSTLTTSYYVFDGHGSVRALTNAAGAITDTYDYDAFGVLTHSTGTTPNNYLFAGEQFDPDLNLYYNRARYLSTNTGRFWTMDTNEADDWDPVSLHRYLYTGNDPVDRIDPSGHDFDLGSLSVAVAVGGTIDAITALRAHETLAGVAKSFLIGSLKGAAFFLAGGVAFKLLATAGQAAASLEAVQAASEFLGNVLARVGPLYQGLQLPVRFSLATEAGEVFFKEAATKHLAQLLGTAGAAGATKLAAALAIEEAKAAVEAAAAEGFEAVAGKLLTVQVGDYTVEIIINAQTGAGQTVKWAVTHLLFIK